jgi:hypothetical protein
MAGKEKLGHTPNKGDGRANQLDWLTRLNDIPPLKRKRTKPNKIPASMEVVCKNPRNRWDMKATRRMMRREDPKTLSSPLGEALLIPMSKGEMKESRVRATKIKITPTTWGVKREESHLSHLNTPISIRKKPPKIIPPSITGSPP